MKRPFLIHFMAIESNDKITIRALLTSIKEHKKSFFSPFFKKGRPSYPLQSYRLFPKNKYTLKIVGHASNNKKLISQVVESDSFGTLFFKFPIPTDKKLSYIQVYETSTLAGIDMHIGSFVPIKIEGDKKIVISDFDKTLVDTAYSSPIDIYRSLRRPLENFPLVPESLKLIKKYIRNNYLPFILTASPHFYQNAIRDWLYQHKIYTAEIFLKDYRTIFSFLGGLLTPKDIKKQGYYKLNHLIDIITMTGIPDELVLMGDNHESDPIIYLAFAFILDPHIDPWHLWRKLGPLKQFQFTRKQKSNILDKMYQIHALTKKSPSPKISIHIREVKKRDPSLNLWPVLSEKAHLIKYYSP